jgi:hypothetical protein
MLKKKLVFAFMLLFICSFVIASETNIKINTLPNHYVNINFLNPESQRVGGFII